MHVIRLISLFFFAVFFLVNASFGQSGMGLTAKYGLVLPSGTYSNFKAGNTASLGVDLLLKLGNKVKLNTGLGIAKSTFSYDRDIVYYANGAVSSDDPNNIKTIVTADASLLTANIPVTLNVELTKNKFIPYVNVGVLLSGKIKYDETYQASSSSYYISDYMNPSVLSFGLVGGIGVRRYFEKVYLSSELTYTGQLNKLNSYSKDNWIRTKGITLSITGGFLF